ncbi:MAG: hypothetical protein V5A62_16470 [Haloarculaceae archaeon]
MRDASLDDFLSKADEEPEGDESEADEASVEQPDTEPEGPPPVDGVEPARSTFAWSPAGAACAECDERVEERWESDSGLVCVECKGW